MSSKSTFRTLVLATSLLVSGNLLLAQSGTSPSSAEVSQIADQIRANPAQMTALIRSAIIRNPSTAPALARQLVALFPDQIRNITSAALTAVQDSGVPNSAALIENTAVAAAEAAVGLGGDFSQQQANVAAVAQGVNDVVASTNAPPVVASVNAVLTPPSNTTPDDTTPPPPVTETEEQIIPPPPTTPDQTSPTE